MTLTAAGGSIGWNVSNAGNAAAVLLTGSSRADVITGGDGADTLVGGAENDTLIGGLGIDSLTGGVGADSFLFASAAAAGDVITDFKTAQADKIDLRPIDPDAAAGDQAFGFIGGAAFAVGVTGQLRFAGGMLQGDLDGDTVADFQIQLTSVASITAAHIWL